MLTVRGQQQCDVHFVGFDHPLHGVVAVQRRQLHDRFDDVQHVVDFIVVQQHLPGAQTLGLGRFRSRLDRGGCAGSAAIEIRFVGLGHSGLSEITLNHTKWANER